jgi:hypothetical protein
MNTSGKQKYVPFTKKEGKSVTNVGSWTTLCEAKAALCKEKTFFTSQLDLNLSKKKILHLGHCFMWC